MRLSFNLSKMVPSNSIHLVRWINGLVLVYKRFWVKRYGSFCYAEFLNNFIPSIFKPGIANSHSTRTSLSDCWPKRHRPCATGSSVYAKIIPKLKEPYFFAQNRVIISMIPSTKRTLWIFSQCLLVVDAVFSQGLAYFLLESL